ncbi:MAG: hypothetical protein K2Y37_27035 [Pirellulales bacterium]|nr:hypothetical protein [Pirellulales bacterium]
MRKRSETISFRAPDELCRFIDKRRAALGVSRGDWVKGVLYALLYDEANETIIALLGELAHDLKKLNTNQARALFAVLTVIGQMTPAEAKQVIRKKFLA